MPRVPDWLLNSAIYLYPTAEYARDGLAFGGSGFLLVVHASLEEPLDPPPPFPEPEEHDWYSGRWFCYGVSSRHVIEAAPVMRLNTLDGKTDVVPLRIEDWEPHPTSDVAVARFDLNFGRHASILTDVGMILTPRELAVVDVGIGDDVNMVGRFINHEGRQTNRPSVRFGNISMMPGEPLEVEGISHPQEAYLIETRTIPGYSGSPVFLDVPTWELLQTEPGTRRREIGEDSRHLNRLLGIAGGWLRGNEQDVWVRRKKAEGFAAGSHSGMMWCVPSHKLLELLNLPKLRAQRDALRDRWGTQRRTR